MKWAEISQNRSQLVLIPTSLDDAIGPGHDVRVIDSLLEQLDWSELEATYHGRLGQPPIHPKILCGVILFGLLCRLRASRKLEEALQVRIDFRWLARGMSIDHTTLSEFRRKHPQQLRNLFVQVVLIGREMGLVRFERIGFDGTRVRANNRKSGTRTPEQLRLAKQKLQEEFDRLNEKADQEDDQDEEAFGNAESAAQKPSGEGLQKQLVRARKRVDAALAELDQIAQTPEKTPNRLPITDPESRFSKTKEGGFAPSYTPTATVDIDSGLMVDQTVIATSNESGELMKTIAQVSQDYSLSAPVSEVLADGLMATGENLQACEELGVDLYSPVPGAHQGVNPAMRAELSEPVAADQLDKLPMKRVNKQARFDKQAFIYDSKRDVYWCPNGKALGHSSHYRTTEAGRELTRDRYRADQAHCQGCPLRDRCLGGKSKCRQIDRGEHEAVVDRQIAKMNQPESKKKYSQRRHPGERPFAVIKQFFGARQFLTRGLTSVRQEWCWLSIAFNLSILTSSLKRQVQPP
jgi:transposase